DGRVYRHAFEDCAHWWALTHHSLIALKKIHQLELVHLDIKGDNVCIPVGPGSFDPDAPGERLQPRFGHLALIDFAFALVSGEAPHVHPHAALISATGARWRERDLAASLASGWTLGRDIDVVPASASPLTPMTRLAPSIRVFVSPRARVADSQIDADASGDGI